MGDAYCLSDGLSGRHASCLAELVHRSVKLLIYALEFVDSDNEELVFAISILLLILHTKNGEVFGVGQDDGWQRKGEEVEDELHDETIAILCAKSRLSAARGMLYLARHPNVLSFVSRDFSIPTVLLSQGKDCQFVGLLCCRSWHLIP